MPADRTPPASDRQEPSSGELPWTIRGAAGVAVIEAAGAGAFVVRYLVDVLPFEDPWLTHAGYALGVIALVTGAAAALVAAARALLRRRHWPRSLLVVAQLMAFAIGIPMVQADDWVGWPVVVLGALGLVLVLHPATTAAIEGDREAS